MKKAYVIMVICCSVVLSSVCAVVLAANLADVQNIRKTILAKSAFFAQSADCVATNFTVLETNTNGTLLEITVKDAYGLGTNGVFSYSLSNTAKVLSVEFRDASNSVVHYDYYPGGTPMRYTEYKEENLNGIYLDFYTNTQISLFLNVSSNYCISEEYAFDEDGNVINAITTSVPIYIDYNVDPPQ